MGAESHMNYRGHVKNGVVVLKKRAKLPEGSEVSVRLVKKAKQKPKKPAKSTMYDRFKDLIGKAEGLPPDASINIDHYLYGLPKRK
jgi:hypothetical protein